MDIDTMRSQAPQYKPSINIAQAPPLMGPALFLVSGWISLMVASQRIISDPQQWQFAHLGSNGTLITVHLITLGFLTMTMFGILYQWVPVVFDRPPVPLTLIFLHWFFYSAGLVLFLLGFSLDNGAVLATGASLLAASIVMFSGFMAKRLIQSSRNKDALTFALIVALAAINATWIFGLSMALGMAGIIAYPNVLAEHINTAWAGWIIMVVLAVQSKLLPMFSMARIDNLRPHLPMVLAFLGLVVQYTVNLEPSMEIIAALFWAAAAITVLWQLHMLWHRRQSPVRDGIFAGITLGWLLWLAAAITLLVKPELSVFLVALGAMTFIFSYQSRIIPFLIALVVGKRLPGPVFKAFFMAQRFNSPLLPLITAVWSLALSIIWLAGIQSHNLGLLSWAGALLLVWPLFHVFFIALKILQAAKTAHSKPNTPEEFK